MPRASRTTKIASEPTPRPGVRTDRLSLPEKASKDLRPIGPERLRELRRMIQDGSYPLDRNAELGLIRLFLQREPPAPDR